MTTAKIFQSGNSQAVRLPKEFKLQASEVFISKVGEALVLIPKNDPWASIETAAKMFTPDCFAERVQPPAERREPL